MLKSFNLAVVLSILAAAHAQTPSRAPSPETLTLSLKTMSKALSGCRASYTSVQDGTKISLVKAIIGASNYDKDMTSLAHAETFVNAMAAHPERVTGKSLVATLSSTDDFYAGVGSTRFAILSSLINGENKVDRSSADELVIASTSLADCQAALFNAGDDFVDLVMNYVGAEDDALASKAAKRH